jgi:transglutaminase-like putative cysteine protease
MLYDIRLAISYTYPGSAGGGRHLVRVMPLDVPGQQRLIAGLLEIVPRPEERQDGVDFFGNATTSFAFRGAHKSVGFKVQARVERMGDAPGLSQSTALAALPAAIDNLTDLGPGSPLHFLAASVRVPQNAAMTDYARAALRPGISAAQAVMAIGERIYSDMAFDPKATTVETLAADAFAKRRGVCQDFSHIMITCLRGIGVPAGYVSGYLRTLPPPGKARLEGADAMHAWVRAWCGPDLGWLEYDPTNACIPTADHIVAAYGRDYSDVSPIKGSLRISGGQKSEQAVDVIPLTG